MFFNVIVLIITSPFQGAVRLWLTLTTSTLKDERSKGWLIDQSPLEEGDIQETDLSQEIIPDFCDYYSNDGDEKYIPSNQEPQELKLRYLPEEGAIGLDGDEWWADNMLVSIMEAIDQLPEKLGVPPGGYQVIDYQPFISKPEYLFPSLILLSFFLSVVMKKLIKRHNKCKPLPVVLTYKELTVAEDEVMKNETAGSDLDTVDTGNYLTVNTVSNNFVNGFHDGGDDNDEGGGGRESNPLTSADRFHMSLKKLPEHAPVPEVEWNSEFDSDDFSFHPPNDEVDPFGELAPCEYIIRKHYDAESSIAESPSKNQPVSRSNSFSPQDSPLMFTLLSDEISNSLEAGEEPLIPVPDISLLNQGERYSNINSLDLANILDAVEKDDLAAEISQPESMVEAGAVAEECLVQSSPIKGTLKLDNDARDNSTSVTKEAVEISDLLILSDDRGLNKSPGLHCFEEEAPLVQDVSPKLSLSVSKEERDSIDHEHKFNQVTFLSETNKERPEPKMNGERHTNEEDSKTENTAISSSPSLSYEPLESDAALISDPSHGGNGADIPILSLDHSTDLEDQISLHANMSGSSPSRPSSPLNSNVDYSANPQGSPKVGKRSPLSSIDNKSIDTIPQLSPSKIPVRLSPNKCSLSRLESPRKKPLATIFEISELTQKYLINREDPDIEAYLVNIFGEDIEIEINVELLEGLSKDNIDKLLKTYKGKETSVNWKIRYDNFGLLIGHLRLHQPKDLYLYFEERLYDVLEDILAMVYTKRTKLVERVILFIRDIVYYSNDFGLDDELFATLLHLLIHLTNSSMSFIRKPALRSLCLMIQALNLDSFKRCFHMIFGNILATKTLQKEKSASLLMIKFYLSVNFHKFTSENFDEILDLLLPSVPQLTIDGYQKTRAELVQIYLIIMKKNPESKKLVAFYDSFSTFVKSKITKPKALPVDNEVEAGTVATN